MERLIEEHFQLQIQRPEDFSTYVAARTTTENILVEIWKQLLGLQQVGIHDNFFELGGHSLLVTQLVSRIEKQMNVKISLRSIFESSTIEAIAGLVEQQQHNMQNDDTILSPVMVTDMLLIIEHIPL